MDCASPVNLLCSRTARDATFTENLIGDVAVNLFLNFPHSFACVRRREFDLRHRESNDSFIKRDGDGHATVSLLSCHVTR